MKKHILLIWIFGIAWLQGCSQQNNILPGKLYNHVAVKNNTSISYAIYIPEKNKPKYPIAFIFFDPHGSGELPVDLYKNLAEEFGIILIGNNNSSNNTDLQLIGSNFSVLLNELKSTYKIEGKDIALWGFSGGAKAAIFNTGLNNNIGYCIYGGAVSPPQNSKIELLGFNGKQDMNYTDLLSFAAQQQNNPMHLQIEFNGKHAWPDTTTSKDAFRWLLLKKIQKKELPADKNFIANSFLAYKKQTEQLLESNQYTDAYQACDKSIYLLQSLTATTYFTTKKAFISNQPLFKKQVQDLHVAFKKETTLKMQYQSDFMTKDTIFWKKEIFHLQKLSETDKSGIYSRLIGFLSLASYSYANHAIQSNDLNALEHILFIYQHADPTNPEQAFMRAKLYAQKMEIENAKTALKEAILLGIDKKRIEEDAVLKKL